MANEVKNLWQGSAAVTITLASLPVSGAATPGLFSGRQGTIITNIADGKAYRKAMIYAKITTIATPAVTSNTKILFFLITGDQNGTAHRSDGAGASDAAIATLANAKIIGSIGVPYTTNSQAYYGEFLIEDLPPKWTIAIAQMTGQALHSVEENHYVRYELFDEEIQ